jgi:hypothetical protein
MHADGRAFASGRDRLLGGHCEHGEVDALGQLGDRPVRRLALHLGRAAVGGVDGALKLGGAKIVQ